MVVSVGIMLADPSRMLCGLATRGYVGYGKGQTRLRHLKAAVLLSALCRVQHFAILRTPPPFEANSLESCGRLGNGLRWF